MDSSRIGLFAQGLVAMMLVACAGCGSSSSNSVSPEGGSSSGSSGSSGSSSGSSGGGSMAPVKGPGMECTKTYPLSVGTLITVAVSWPGTAAVAKGSGNFYIWLLTVYSVDASNKITGTSQSCGNTPAILTLSNTGDIALGVPGCPDMCQTGLIKPLYPPSSWDGSPTTAIKGTLGGTTVGSSFEVDPSVSLYGLKASDPLSDPTMKWVGSYSALTMSDLTYADGGAYVAGQGHPGIKGTFDGTPPYYLSGTSLAPNAPKTDTFWSVSRSEIGMYGISTSCTEIKGGTANVTLINNRIVGCDLINDGGPCTTDQYGFLDMNTTQYTPGKATFDSVDLTSGATCADVLSKLPMPSM
jgi:hypothetical protein